MENSRKVVLVVVVTLVVIALIAILGGVITGQNQNTGNYNIGGYEKYFNPDEVTRVDITIDKDIFENMLKTVPDSYAVADISLNGDTYKNVGIKFKGASSLEHVKNSKTSNRFSFSIKADKFIKGNSIAGLDNLILNGNNSDATMMREYLAYDILEKSGVKSPLHSYAAIYINGEYWGFYHMVEGVNKSFILRNYGSNKGNLYKPEGKIGINTLEGYVTDTTIPHHGGHLEYCGDNASIYDELFSHTVMITDTQNYSDKMLNIIKNLNEGKNIDKILNIEELIPYFAVNTVISNTDSYVNNIDTHNFYIYEDDGKVTIFPWDNDYAFGPYFLGALTSVNLPIDDPIEDHMIYPKPEDSYKEVPIFGAIVENPEYRKKYHDSIQYITENYMGENLIKKIDNLSSMIRPYMEADPYVSYPVDKYFDNAIANLKKFVLLRTESIQKQLEGKIPTTFYEQNLHLEKLVDPEDLDVFAIGCGSMWDSIWP